MQGSIRTLDGVDLKEGDKVKIKDEIWLDHTFVGYTYVTGTVEAKEDGWYVGDRKLLLWDDIYLLKE